MSVLADDVAGHDWSVTGAGICGKSGRSMVTLTWQRHICTSAAVADRGPARKNEILMLLCWDRYHDVSILITVGGDGLYCGVEPRLKVSMMFMRPPQHGHGWVAWSVALGRRGPKHFRDEALIAERPRPAHLITTTKNPARWDNRAGLLGCALARGNAPAN